MFIQCPKCKTRMTAETADRIVCPGCGCNWTYADGYLTEIAAGSLPPSDNAPLPPSDDADDADGTDETNDEQQE